MKFSVALLVLGLSSVSAFAPSAAFTKSKASLTQVNSEPDEEGGLDLDLGEMFEMFEAADKGKDFDDTIKKVKSDEN
eukprot:jgi/Psemu1/12517/gm1.12517_g